MKSLQIIALALCLNVPMAHANDQMATSCTSGQMAGATAIIAAVTYGSFHAALNCFMRPSLSRGLIWVGSTLAITGASQAAINTLECPPTWVGRTFPGDNASSAAMTVVGLGLIATGNYLEHK
jgi:hypothetical protein